MKLLQHSTKLQRNKRDGKKVRNTVEISEVTDSKNVREMYNYRVKTSNN